MTSLTRAWPLLSPRRRSTFTRDAYGVRSPTPAPWVVLYSLTCANTAFAAIGAASSTSWWEKPGSELGPTLKSTSTHLLVGARIRNALEHDARPFGWRPKYLFGITHSLATR